MKMATITWQEFEFFRTTFCINGLVFRAFKFILRIMRPSTFYEYVICPKSFGVMLEYWCLWNAIANESYSGHNNEEGSHCNLAWLDRGGQVATSFSNVT